MWHRVGTIAQHRGFDADKMEAFALLPEISVKFKIVAQYIDPRATHQKQDYKFPEVSTWFVDDFVASYQSG